MDSCLRRNDGGVASLSANGFFYANDGRLLADQVPGTFGDESPEVWETVEAGMNVKSSTYPTEPITYCSDVDPALTVRWDTERDILYLAGKWPPGGVGDTFAKGTVVFFELNDEKGKDSDEIRSVMLMDASKVLAPYLEAMAERVRERGGFKSNERASKALALLL